jgi:response regulator RpfG family c-di-GMP phosphodiesterase
MGMSSLDREKLHRMKEKENEIKKYTIMIVDDEEAQLKSIESLLSDEYNVITDRDGQDALEIIEKMEHPEELSLVISDQRMPGLTGIQLFERLVHIIPDAIRIILAGYDDKDVILDAINKTKIYEFILKPFDPDDFKLRVKRAVETFDRQLEVETNYRKMKKEYQELKQKNKELRDQLVKSQTIPLPIKESREKAAMKISEKKENWQERMKIKPKLLTTHDEAFAPMEDIWDDYI